MEALTQYVIPLTRRVKKYVRGTRRDIVEDVFHNVISEVKYFRCRHCGKYKAPSATECCDKCAVQMELFV